VITMSYKNEWAPFPMYRQNPFATLWSLSFSALVQSLRASPAVKPLSDERRQGFSRAWKGIAPR
jgi:hypothetical protein